MLGTADRVVVMKEQTTIVTDDRNSEAVKARIAMIRKEAEGTETKVRDVHKHTMQDVAHQFTNSEPGKISHGHL